MEHFHRWNAKNESTLKLHHVPGKAVMIDYAGKKLQWVDRDTGEVHEEEVFIAAMPHSGYVYAEASATQQKEDFIGSVKSCLNYLGGVPEMLVTDNLKSAVHKARKYGVAQPYLMKTYQRAKVQKSSHVYMSADKHYYSVPYRYISRHVHIRYTDRVVEVYYDHQRIASHMRHKVRSGYTTKKEHLPSNHQEYLGWSKDYFLARAALIGPHTRAYLTRVFEQAGFIETKYKTALGIVHLTKHFSADRIERACKLAYLHPSASYHRIHNILLKNADTYCELFDEQERESEIPDHENIRGPEYFN